MLKNKALIASLGLVSITILSGVFLMSSYSSATSDNTDAVDDVSITVPVSCSMEGTGMNSHNANIVNGTYQADIGSTTLKVFCNDEEGFAIYAIGFTDDEYGKTVLTNSALGSTYDIATGTATSGSTSNWAMKLTAPSNPTPTYPITITSDTSGSFSSYHAVPSEYTKVVTRTSGTDIGTVAEGSSLTTTYAAYISKTQPADTYSGKVKYTLVHPNDAPAPTPPPTPPTSCTTPVPNLTYMQDLNSSNKATVLSNMIEDQQYYLADKRDNKAYCVAKLKDSNIWMTQNLDLDLDSTKTYTSADTDITANWTPALSTYPTGTTTWNASNTAPESYDPGTLYWNGTADTEFPSTEADCTAAGGTWDSANERCNFISSTGNSHNHLGNYYNWTAAVAMNDSSSYTTYNQDVNQSICPANWTLPKGGNVTTSGSFQYLVTQYGWDSSSYKMENPTIWNSPIKASLSGSWYGSLGIVGEDSRFWSLMVTSSNNSYNLGAFSDGNVSPDNYGARDDGLSVRCLAR